MIQNKPPQKSETKKEKEVFGISEVTKLNSV